MDVRLRPSWDYNFYTEVLSNRQASELPAKALPCGSRGRPLNIRRCDIVLPSMICGTVAGVGRGRVTRDGKLSSGTSCSKSSGKTGECRINGLAREEEKAEIFSSAVVVRPKCGDVKSDKNTCNFLTKSERQVTTNSDAPKCSTTAITDSERDRNTNDSAMRVSDNRNNLEDSIVANDGRDMNIVLPEDVAKSVSEKKTDHESRTTCCANSEDSKTDQKGGVVNDNEADVPTTELIDSTTCACAGTDQPENRVLTPTENNHDSKKRENSTSKSIVNCTEKPEGSTTASDLLDVKLEEKKASGAVTVDDGETGRSEDSTNNSTKTTKTEKRESSTSKVKTKKKKDRLTMSPARGKITNACADVSTNGKDIRTELPVANTLHEKKNCVPEKKAKDVDSVETNNTLNASMKSLEARVSASKVDSKDTEMNDTEAGNESIGATTGEPKTKETTGNTNGNKSKDGKNGKTKEPPSMEKPKPYTPEPLEIHDVIINAHKRPKFYLDRNFNTTTKETDINTDINKHLEISLSSRLSDPTSVHTKHYNDPQFLKTLGEKERLVLIEHIPLEVTGELQDMVSDYGTIELFLTEFTNYEREQQALVKMADESECDFVVACLDGYNWDALRLKVQKIEDILAA